MMLSKPISRFIEKLRSTSGGIGPYNLLVFANHPQHYSDDDKPPPGDHWAAFIAAKPRVPVFEETGLTGLIGGLDLYRKVPTNFPKLLPDTNVPA
jgi:hypothetical protein